MENDFENGMSAMKSKNYPAAIRYFSMCIDVNPKNFDAFLQRGIAKSHITRFEEDIDDVIADFHTAIYLNPNLYEAYYERGVAFIHTENFMQAIFDFSKAIEMRPTSAIAYLQRAKSYIQVDQFAESIRDLDYFIDKNEFPNDTLLLAYKYRALSYFRLKKYNNAILDSYKILSIKEEADSYVNRGKAYLHLGNFKDATNDFKNALKIDSNDQNAIFNLKIIEDVSNIKNIRGERTLADFLIGISELVVNQDFDNLYNEANECVKVYPEFYLGYFYRALVYQERKEYYKLNVDINVALKLKPGNKLALGLLEEIPYNFQRINNSTDQSSNVEKQKKNIVDFFAKLSNSGNRMSNSNFDYTKEPIKKPTIEWVDIPSGSFIMGSPDNEKGRRYVESQCQVTISGFKMSKHAITFEQFDLFCDNTFRLKPRDDNWGRGPGWGRGKQPAIFVSWFDAQAFAEWMGCRLPTGAEWEYACRAGTTTAFNTGKSITTDEANFNGNYPYNTKKKGENRGKPMPVGSFPPNAWGLCEMHGNVGEWCNDWCGENPLTPLINPQGPLTGEYRMIRGGSFAHAAESARSAASAGTYPYNFGEHTGFRLVLIENEIL